MNSSSALFVAFVALLVLATVSILWWFGPLATLALDGDKRDAPYSVLEFSRDLPDDSLLDRVGDFVVEDGGSVQLSGEKDHFLAGEVLTDEWQAVRGYSFVTGAEYLRMITSEEFRSLTSDLGDSRRMVLGLDTTLTEQALPQALSVWLFRRTETQMFEAASPLLTTAQKFGGREVLRTTVDVLNGREPWDLLMIIGFDDRQAALSWYRDPLTSTEVALLEPLYEDVVGILFQVD